MSEEIERVEDAMRGNREQLTHELDKLARDRDLTPEAKRARESALREAAQDRHQELLSKRRDAVENERARLYRRAFNQPITETTAYRQAYALADDTPDQKTLERLKARAANTNDSLLAAAVRHAAFDKGHFALLADAPPEVESLIDFDLTHGKAKAVDPEARLEQLRARLARSVRLASPV